MNDEQKWNDISNDISDVAKKIKSRIDEEDLVDDLKDTFKNTIENTSQLINNIIKNNVIAEYNLSLSACPIPYRKRTIEISIQFENLRIRLLEPGIGFKRACDLAILQIRTGDTRSWALTIPGTNFQQTE